MCLLQTNALSKDPECDSGVNSSVNNEVSVVTPSVHKLMSIIHCLYLLIDTVSNADITKILR